MPGIDTELPSNNLGLNSALFRSEGELVLPERPSASDPFRTRPKLTWSMIKIGLNPGRSETSLVVTDRNLAERDLERQHFGEGEPSIAPVPLQVAKPKAISV